MSIEAIKEALAAGPTEGPWVSDDNEGHSPLKIWAGCAPSGHSEIPGTMVAIIYETARECEENADFIAACNPVAIRSLIERLEAAEAENAQLLAGIAKCRDLIPTPKHLDAEWIAAMGHPLDALAYIAAAMESGGLAEGVNDA